MKAKINDNAFSGLTQFNGQTVTQETHKTKDERNGKPIIGESGNTMAFALSTGGRVFLTADQYTEV